MKRAWIVGLAAAALGAAVWGGVAAATGRREAWDAGAYFSLGLPLLYASAGLFAWIEPRRSWRWAVIPFLAQFLWMAVVAGLGGLWPLGLAFMGILSLPGIAIARWSARRRLLRDGP